jgi:hypothetical protein
MSLPPCHHNWSYNDDQYLLKYLVDGMELSDIAIRLQKTRIAVSSRISTIIYHWYKIGTSLSYICENINLPLDEINERIYKNLSGPEKEKYDIRMINYKLDKILNLLSTSNGIELEPIDKYAGLFDKK